MKQVFISYPRDKAAGQVAARALHSALQKEQISTFLDDESIEPGDRWLKKLKDGIAGCKVMLTLISEASDDRLWVEREFIEAQKHDILIIPVLVEAADIPMQMGDMQAVSLYGEQAVEHQAHLFQKIRKHLGIEKINPLIKQAIQAKRTDAYEKALEIWQEVLTLSSDKVRAQNEIEKLQSLNETKTRADQLLQRLVPRISEIGSVFTQAAGLLNQAAKRPESMPLLELTEQFLDNLINAADYVKACQVIFQTPASTVMNAPVVDYSALAERICRGEIVLFLGSEIAEDYGNTIRTERQVADKLASQTRYDNSERRLSSVAEYMRLQPEYGPSGLWSRLQKAIEEGETEAALYQLLARINAPLVLISSAYDDTLERSFKATNKPFVELSSIVNRSDDYDVGQVIVSYSDNFAADRAYAEEELSALKLYEAGYSIIYKIRGSCCSGSDSELKRDALTVSESDYFIFARYAEKIIPSYLAKQFRGRGFLFLGFSPASWEQRLLVGALLAKRKNANEGCFTVGASRDPLEVAYWQKQKVQHYDVDLSQLDDHIEEALL